MVTVIGVLIACVILAFFALPVIAGGIFVMGAVLFIISIPVAVVKWLIDLGNQNK